MAPRVVLITGTSVGLGLELAKLLLAEPDNYKVVGTSRGPLDAGHELSKAEGYVHKELDVASDKSVEEVFDAVGSELGTVDVLVNNAAFGIFGTTEHTDIDRWHALYETNVFGIVRTTHAALKFMRKQRAGQIVNITSIAGFQGMSFTDCYVSSKFAVEGLTECQATYLHRYGIQISLVEPGPILTDFIPRVEKDHKLVDESDDYGAITKDFEEQQQNMFKDESMVQTPDKVAKVAKQALDDYPTPQLRYQTSDFVKTAAADKFKDPTGYSLIEKYGRSAFKSQDVLPKTAKA